MNNNRRKTLKLIISELSRMLDMINTVIDDEQYSLDSVPENLQGSIHVDNYQDAIDNMTDATESIQEAIDSLLSIR